ncbi:MAG: CsgG/HfaB family protein [Shewanella sp.]|nr:CsgG/HfaB family protein [Shewanella sp.]MCF1459515.1 CsgG/HfaB family protein [Shewanella sp.]
MSGIIDRKAMAGQLCFFKGITMKLSIVSSVVLTGLMTLPLSTSFAKTLDATKPMVVEQVPSENFLKRKVAIARFTNETQAANSFLVDAQGDRLGKQAADILSARLAETKKFVLFERIDDALVTEESILKGEGAGKVPVDYLIVGSISEFGRSTESTTGVFSRSKQQKAFAKVNIRLIDVETGAIVDAIEGAGEAITETKKTLGAGTSAGYDQSLTDKAFSQAISQMISNLVEGMTNKPWKSYFLSYEEGAYIISGGESQGIQAGQEFVVYQSGKRVKNPQTGTYITLPGKAVGKVSVVSTYGTNDLDQISFVSLTEGQLETDLSQYYLSDK